MAAEKFRGGVRLGEVWRGGVGFGVVRLHESAYSEVMSEHNLPAINEGGARVVLTPSEYYFAAMVGLQRQFYATLDGKKADWEDGTELEHHMQGAVAEAAYCKWRGHFWSASINTHKAADAPDGIEVRSTSRERPFFKVKPQDLNDRKVVFVITGQRVHDIVGWLPMAMAKKIGKWEDPYGRQKPCWRLALSQLFPLGRLFHE